MREYVEKVSAPTGDKVNKATVTSSNANMTWVAQLLISQKAVQVVKQAQQMSAKEDNAGNVNVPGGKASKSMSNAKAPATGEKAG